MPSPPVHTHKRKNQDHDKKNHEILDDDTEHLEKKVESYHDQHEHREISRDKKDGTKENLHA